MEFIYYQVKSIILSVDAQIGLLLSYHNALKRPFRRFFRPRYLIDKYLFIYALCNPIARAYYCFVVISLSLTKIIPLLLCKNNVLIFIFQPIMAHIIRTTPEASPETFCGLILQRVSDPNFCAFNDPRFEWQVELPEKSRTVPVSIVCTSKWLLEFNRHLTFKYISWKLRLVNAHKYHIPVTRIMKYRIEVGTLHKYRILASISAFLHLNYRGLPSRIDTTALT